MKVCFAVKAAQGLESEVYGHFGSAPAFLLFDTSTGEFEEIANADAHHAHGQCSPLKALGGRRVDAVVVGGIGGGALSKLGSSGVEVFRAAGGTVKENMTLLSSGELRRFNPSLVCRGHGSAGGCGHH